MVDARRCELLAGRAGLDDGCQAHPVVGAQELHQLKENLAAATLRLPGEAVRRLDVASEIDLGFPAEFIRELNGFVYGTVGGRASGTGYID